MNSGLTIPSKTTILVVVSIIAFVILCGIAVLMYREFQNRFSSSAYDMCSDKDFENVHLDPNYLLKLHYLLHVSNEILQKARVEYVAISGTLLSIFRTGFLTPWDDDGDLNVFKPDFEKNKSIIDRLLNEYGLYLKDPFWFASLEIFQLCFVDGHPMQRKYPSDCEPFVDWVLYKKMSNQVAETYDDHKDRDVYHFSSSRERDLFPKEYLFDNELYPIKEKSLTVFSETTAKRLNVENPTLTLKVPNNSIALLNRCYGKKEDKSMWKTCYLASSHHSMGLFVKPCKLTEEQVQKLLN